MPARPADGGDRVHCQAGACSGGRARASLETRRTDGAGPTAGAGRRPAAGGGDCDARCIRGGGGAKAHGLDALKGLRGSFAREIRHWGPGLPAARRREPGANTAVQHESTPPGKLMLIKKSTVRPAASEPGRLGGYFFIPRRLSPSLYTAKGCECVGRMLFPPKPFLAVAACRPQASRVPRLGPYLWGVLQSRLA